MEWDEPGPDFEAFVVETVRKRLGKYSKTDHWAQLSHDEAHMIAQKVQKTILDNERKVPGFAPCPFPPCHVLFTLHQAALQHWRQACLILDHIFTHAQSVGEEWKQASMG